jgi:cellulose synthase/poly-beta-1,6-N-acetylglucosamine synthase-like glycosyltransferase
MFLSIVVGLLMFLYALIILIYSKGWKLSSTEAALATFSPSTRFSIIIAARNEEINVADCLDSIKKINYPKQLYEVIVVDDHSEDNTASVVRSYHDVCLLQLKDEPVEGNQSYKKQAIALGISKSTGDYIVTTDADCMVSPDWLRCFDQMIQEKACAFIAAPVAIHKEKGWLHLFESLDFMMLQGITAAAVQSGIHPMSNGANLCYKKSVFYDVSGFHQIDQIASGDDILLMQKITDQFPGSTHYCKSKNAIVFTKGSDNLMSFLRQRIRWASKGKYYKGIFFKAAVILVFALNCSLIYLFSLCFFNQQLWLVFVSYLIIKSLIELIFLYPVADFYGKKKLLWAFVPLQPLHIIYMVIAGTIGNVGKYQWKGRMVH